MPLVWLAKPLGLVEVFPNQPVPTVRVSGICMSTKGWRLIAHSLPRSEAWRLLNIPEGTTLEWPKGGYVLLKDPYRATGSLGRALRAEPGEWALERKAGSSSLYPFAVWERVAPKGEG